MRPVLAILAVAGFFTLAGPVPAQPSDSHIRIKDWGGAGGEHDPRALGKILGERLGTRPPPRPPGGIDPDLAKQLFRQMNGMNDPRDREKWQEFLKNNPAISNAAREALNDPKRREALLNQLQGLMKDQNPWSDNFKQRDGVAGRFKEFSDAVGNMPRPAPIGPPPDISVPHTGTPSPVGPQITPKPPGSTPPVTPGPIPRPSVPNGPRPGPQSLPRDNALGRDFAKAIERWAPKSMGNSPAMKRLGAELRKKDWGKVFDSTLSKTGNGPDVNWDRVGRGFRGTGRFFDRNLPNVSSRHLPDMPHVSAPNLPNAPNMPTLPSVAAPSAGGAAMAGGTFTVLLVIAAVLVGGFLAWRLIIRPMQLANRATTETAIGPWPVDPARIRTREDLVKAFDHLALRSGGLPARLWHHRQAANKLGAEDPHRRQTAANLAETYARARYAPPAEPLDEPTALRARRDLCALAGEAAP
jgi:hypothetical protein